jgi:hypothetical protein
VEIEAETAASIPADSEAGGTNKTQGDGGSFVPAWLEDGWDITDGSTHERGKGTAWCGAEAEHTRAVQTAARVPAASREGYVERRLFVHPCP